ncbi:MAG: hypothetical protein WC459_02575 [Patescibacteria group bacterium]
MIHISSLSNTTFIAGMKKMLEEHGFENVDIGTLAVPQNLSDSLKKALIEEGEDGETLSGEELGSEFEYYRVTTKQGTFGLFMGLYPMLDLTETGILLSEFLPVEDAADIPPDFPPLVGFGDSEQLLLLWQLLTKKKAQP